MKKSRTELLFLETVRREGILPEGSRIVAAVSGGSDSVGMLHLLNRFRGHMDWDLSVLHIDHQARPDSTDDADFVMALSRSLGLDGEIHKLEGRNGSGEASEAWMSASRQRIYVQVSRERQGSLVAVGHTMDDRAETFLMRLAEGAGLRGLGGMDYVGMGPVRRPVLDLSREELRGYLSDNGFQWIEDATNEDPRIRRNRIRQELLPVFEAIYPGVRSRIARSAALITSWRDHADRQILTVLADILQRPLSDSRPAIDRQRYCGLGEALRLSVLWHICGRPRHGGDELEKTDRWLISGGEGRHAMPGGSVLEASAGLIEIVTGDDSEDGE